VKDQLGINIRLSLLFGYLQQVYASSPMIAPEAPSEGEGVFVKTLTTKLNKFEATAADR